MAGPSTINSCSAGNRFLIERAPVRLTIQALQNDILEAYGDPRAVAAQAFRRARTWDSWPPRFALGKRQFPVSISYNVTPRLNTSAGAPTVVRTGLLGRDIGIGAVDSRRARIPGHPHRSEIEQHRTAVNDDDVAGLHIHMEKALGVHVLERGAEVNGNPDGIGHAETFARLPRQSAC
jgi:hypothetical protein